MKSSSRTAATMTIGELSARFDLAPHVLRHWEAMGLLAPAARVNGRRRYAQEHLTRVAMIVGGKSGGLSLEQLRDLSPPAPQTTAGSSWSAITRSWSSASGRSSSPRR